MSVLQIRPATECTYDIVSLGEVMLRLDPGDGRIRTARQFRASEGGGEYNVARGLRRCFGKRGAIVSSLVCDEVGKLVEDLMLTSGLDTQFVKWVAADGMGRTVRNGLNFTERGYGVRGAVGCSDRGNTAASKLAPGDIDWEHIFGDLGVRWLHTGGIFAALSDSAAKVALEALEAAHRHGTIVSYDLNYRRSLWEAHGGKERAQRVNRELAQHVDVMIGNEEDFSASLGFVIEGTDSNLQTLPLESFKKMIDQVHRTFPNISAIGTTLRQVRTATINDWGAIAWKRDQGFAQATQRNKLEILDRVGGGDSFASGLIYALMESGDIRVAVEYGAAHGALAMTTPGDTSMANLEEVQRLIEGAGTRIQR